MKLSMNFLKSVVSEAPGHCHQALESSETSWSGAESSQEGARTFGTKASTGLPPARPVLLDPGVPLQPSLISLVSEERVSTTSH